jgi:hypothetical protein
VQLRVVDAAGNIETLPGLGDLSYYDLTIGQTDVYYTSSTPVPAPASSETGLPTDAVSNADGQIYYAGDNPSGAAPIQNGVDIIATGAGNNDWVHGIGLDTTGTLSLAVQHDTVSGGAGNDYVGIVGTDFTSVDGGAGWNTLAFDGSNLPVDLAQMSTQVHGVAECDWNNQSNNATTDPRGQFSAPTTGNTLELRLSDILSEANGTVGSNTQHMTILGNNTSTVMLEGTSDAAGLAAAGWATTGQQTINGVTFDVWHNASMGVNTAADLLIEHGVHVL